MKYGMNLLLWTGSVAVEHFPLLAKLKAAGFDGVEIPVFGGEPADYKPVRAERDKNGLKCTTVTILTAETNAVSPDAAVRKNAVEWLKKVVEINHVLGSETVCGPYHSAIGVFSGSGPTADEKKRSADVLRQAAEFARQANLMMAIEYLNRFECYVLNTAVGAVELVGMVNHPNFRTMFDTFHAHIEEKSQAAAIRTVKPVRESTSWPVKAQIPVDGVFDMSRYSYGELQIWTGSPSQVAWRNPARVPGANPHSLSSTARWPPSQR